MELNKSNLFARYYNWVWDKLPDDVCTFFWMTLLSIILSPLLIPGTWINRSIERKSWQYYDTSLSPALSFIFWIVILLSYAIGNIISRNIGVDNNGFIMTLVSILTGLFSIVFTILFILTFVFLIASIIKYLETTRKEKKKEYKEPDHKLRDFIAAIRGKYCTKINWK